jgi:hypothetical protein
MQSLSETYEEFRAFKYNIRKYLTLDRQFQLQGQPKYIDDGRQFWCPAVNSYLYVTDEIDVAIARAALNPETGGRIPERVDFLLRPTAAGWLQLSFGNASLPSPATEPLLGVEHGASLVFSQHERDGTVIVALYPPNSKNCRPGENFIILGYFKSPRFVGLLQIEEYLPYLITYQRAAGFGQQPTRWDHLIIWWLKTTRVVNSDKDTQPSDISRRRWLVDHLKNAAKNCAFAAGSLILIYLAFKILVWFGLGFGPSGSK